MSRPAYPSNSPVCGLGANRSKLKPVSHHGGGIPGFGRRPAGGVLQLDAGWVFISTVGAIGELNFTAYALMDKNESKLRTVQATFGMCPPGTAEDGTPALQRYLKCGPLALAASNPPSSQSSDKIL